MIKRNKKGFTLIELLVVIAIIGLLSTMAVVALNNARAKSRDAKRVSDVKQMQTALELYFNQCNGYPTLDGSGAAHDGTSRLDADSVFDNGAACGTTLGTYMADLPNPPSPTDGSVCIANDTNTYYYEACNADASACGGGASSDNGASYTIQYCVGENTGNLTGNITHYATPAGM
ncbi:MAG: type II secretion system protein [Patescibacteria group bacterium]|nr:type II secretion system protein [Patescibacteria group bacterium]